MKTEIEVKFLNIDLASIRARLTNIGAVCEQPLRLMRRVTYHTPDMLQKKAYLRVRDEGNRVTCTYKQFNAQSIDGAKEIEIVVSSFEDTIAIFERAGHKPTAYQETRRETWKIDSTEIMIDEWPWLKPFIEIEGASEPALKTVAEKLGLTWKNAVFGAITAAYDEQYPNLVSSDFINQLAEIKFDLPVPKQFTESL